MEQWRNRTEGGSGDVGGVAAPAPIDSLRQSAEVTLAGVFILAENHRGYPRGVTAGGGISTEVFTTGTIPQGGERQPMTGGHPKSCQVRWD